jgi:hypothetical protein
MKCFILLIFLSYSAWAVPTLNELMNIDRFHAYTQSWAQTMKGRGKEQMAEAILKLTPKEIADFNFDANKMGDAFNYDEFIFDYLQKKHPQLKVAKTDVEWNYNFYKRKINEAYLVDAPTQTKAVTSPIVEPGVSKGKITAVDPLDSSEVLLNVDGYVSGRTTRAVFWEASLNQRPIELHVGSAADFKTDLARRGAKIVGEVKTHARNYNPIYLVQDPGSKSYHYAITQISGNDRVRHLSMQSSLVRWEGTKGALAPPPPVSVVGDAAQLLAKEEATLTQVLKVIPKADQVVIGQKGAFERTFSSMAKANAVLDLVVKHPTALDEILTPAQKKVLLRLKDNRSEIVSQVMKNASDWDKIYESSLPVIQKFDMPEAKSFTVFDLDRGSYEFSDYLLKTEDGATQRWRIFSNSWGDEILPVAHALKNTGHTNVTYIGTAGALPGYDIKVGDLVMPESAYDSKGTLRPMTPSLTPEGAKKIQAVTNVASPFEETGKWLTEKKAVAQAVEVETGHLSAVFNGKDDRVTTMLLISDAVGVEGETLAEASSSVRRNAQIRAISSVINTAEAKVPEQVIPKSNLTKMIEELIPSKDNLYKFHIQRKAQLADLENDPNPRAQLQKLIDDSPSFTTARVESVLNDGGAKLENLLRQIEDTGLMPRLSIESDFLNGVWNPKKPVSLHFEVSDEKTVRELQDLVAKLKKSDKNFAKYLSVEISSTQAPNTYIRLAKLPDSPEILLELYKDSAIGFGGLAPTETRSGGLKFVQVAEPQSGKAITSTAYFDPNEETMKLLTQFKDKDEAKEFLEKYISKHNSQAQYQQWQVVLNETPSLPNGSLAQLVPEYPNPKKLNITLYITPQGLKNPAVVAEELIHLDQILGSYSRAGTTTSQLSFVNPFHWAETVANAKSGSTSATRKLAAMELEAAMGAKDFIKQPNITKLMGGESSELIDQYLASRQKHAEEIYKTATKDEKADLVIKNKAWEEQKKAFAALESQEDKLNDMIARNDRKGVKKLLETYLPWPLMEPTEQKMWREWLDAIENPNPKNADLFFRGMDGETILRNANGDPYLMSTVLTKNQGNYTRRLRSLGTMRERFGSNHINNKFTSPIKGYKSNPALTVMMLNHMDTPVGSPFLSVSDDRVAQRFGESKKAAILIDRRRLLSNSQAYNLPDEYERLIPLIVFPDEVVHLEVAPKIDANNYGTLNESDFIKEVEKKIGRKVNKMELSSHNLSYFHFVQDSVEQTNLSFLDPSLLPKVGACSIQGGNNSCNCLFKTLNALLK